MGEPNIEGLFADIESNGDHGKVEQRRQVLRAVLLMARTGQSYGLYCPEPPLNLIMRVRRSSLPNRSLKVGLPEA